MSKGSPKIASRLRSWCRRWGVPDLAREVRVEFSPRLRTSLGRCRLAEKRILLHPELAGEARELLLEALCHEAAHLAAREIHGARIRPHGEEWASLVRAAGFEPRVRITRASRVRKREEGGASVVYEHRCPVCQFVRISRRPVRAWKCRDCVDAGLIGRLEIRTRPGRSA